MLYWRSTARKSVAICNPIIIMIDHDRFIKSLGKCYQLHLAEMCPVGSGDVDAPRLNAYQVMRCFDWPIKVDSVDHVTQRIITRMHPLVVITKLLAAHPKQIISFRFGLSHTLYLTPSIDEDDYFTNDPMPFRYKRMTRYLPITFNHKDL